MINRSLGSVKISKLFRSCIHLLSLLIIVVFSYMVILATIAYAQEEISASIRVYPVKVDMPVAPGEATSAKISVKNTAKLKAKITVYVQDFTRDEKGNYTFYKLGERALPISAAKWITLSDKQFVLNPDKTATVTVNFSAPKDTEPGGHYAMVFVEAKPLISEKKKPKGAYILGKARVGVLILGTVAGDIHRQGFLKSITIPRFNLGGSIPITLVFKNTGNVHMDIVGKVYVKSMGGLDVGSIPIDERTSLPSSQMVIETTWENPPWIGKFTARAKVISRDRKKWIKKQSFYIIPVKQVTLGVVAIAIVSILIYGLRKKFRFRIERRD